jgi:hypothetical protein
MTERALEEAFGNYDRALRSLRIYKTTFKAKERAKQVALEVKTHSKRVEKMNEQPSRPSMTSTLSWTGRCGVCGTFSPSTTLRARPY